jgi:PhoH-like ATPase
MMKKIFVLDTNILLNDPESIFAFEDNEVVIPIVCIEEIDKFKRDQNERGRSARAVSRHLDRLRKEHNINLAQGVPLENGGHLRVELGWDAVQKYPYRNGEMNNDDRILAIALAMKSNPDQLPVVFLSRDTNLRIRADAIGICAQDYNSDHINIDELYPGVREIFVPSETIDRLYQNKEVEILGDDLYSNEFILLRNETNPTRTGIGRVSPDKTKISSCCHGTQQVWGITPRNLEQRIAVELLLDDRLSLVTLVGRAGTGKTLLALACGLSKAVDERKYRKLLVSRPIFPMGRDLGYLPGEISDKLKPWMQPIFDNLEMLLDSAEEHKNKTKYRAGAFDLIEQGMLEVEALTYIRGRSIPNQYFIVDEAQNLTPHEIKTIVTRAGNGTKIVLTGDPYQIDNPYLDSESTGLTHVVERFKGLPIAGHITLSKGERSPLAQIAADVL